MRLRMTVAYTGTAYSGWQVQPEAPTVQGTLEDAVARIGGRRTRVIGASRTDAGVHATGQICHFDAARMPVPEAWLAALNAVLPSDVRIMRCARADPGFHARYDARHKTYRYLIDRHPVASPFLAPFAWHCPDLVLVAEMEAAAGLLAGPVDQRVFASGAEGDDRPLRPVESCTVETGRVIAITVVGRSFLRHAVRGMVGSLAEVGRGRRRVEEFAALARADADRPPMAKAPAHGLWLAGVEYGEPTRR